MKNIALIIVFFLGVNSLFAQKVVKQDIDKPAEGKSLVYIAKTGAGVLLNFRIYDNNKFLGAIPSGKYLVYECEPGKHLFWAASENRDYIEASLEPNAVYVINAEGQMGAFIAGVNFKPLNPNEFKDKRLFYQVIKRNKKMTFNNPKDDKIENVQKSLEKYNKLKENNSKKIKILDSSWNFENADKPVRN